MITRRKLIQGICYTSAAATLGGTRALLLPAPARALGPALGKFLADLAIAIGGGVNVAGEVVEAKVEVALADLGLGRADGEKQ